jgi:hypothetical protein
VTGTYRVALYEDGHDGSGLFNVSLESLAGGLGGSSNEGAAPVCAAADGVRHLDCGVLATGTFDAPGDSDAYTFLGEAGETWRITTGELSFSGVLPRVALSAPDGSPVDLNGSAAFCAGACTSVALPANGTYTVVVAEDTLLATGDYEIRAEEVSGGSPACTSVCSDGIDNDGDGLIDFPADAGCLGPDDFSELPACSDGVDGDGDGLVDYPSDPGCLLAGDFAEDPACDDGRDNDGDGTIDWDGGGFGAPDPQCKSPSSDSETKGNGRCGLGFELAIGLPVLMTLRRRRRAR